MPPVHRPGCMRSQRQHCPTALIQLPGSMAHRNRRWVSSPKSTAADIFLPTSQTGITLKWRPSSLFPDNSMLARAEEIKEVRHRLLFPCPLWQGRGSSASSHVSLDAPHAHVPSMRAGTGFTGPPMNQMLEGPLLVNTHLSSTELHHALLCSCWKCRSHGRHQRKGLFWQNMSLLGAPLSHEDPPRGDPRGCISAG